MKTVLICFLASLGAGLTTGFVGLSAAVFITPMLTAFLKLPFYDAVGISLASDVLASAVSAVTYRKKGFLDLKKGKFFTLAVWGGAILGSIVAFFLSSESVGNTLLGYWSLFGAFLVGLDLFLRAKKERKSLTLENSKNKKILIPLCGLYIGFVCGFQGTGGGIMLLLALTLLLNFEYKTAVGTSVFIMALTAFIGAVSHFLINGTPDMLPLLLCVIGTTLFARLGAVIATRAPAPTLKRITGIFLIISSVLLLFVNLL